MEKNIPIIMAKEKNHLKWRTWAKNVAYIDLALISMGLPASIVCVIMGVNNGVVVQPAGEQLSEEEVEGIKKLVVTFAITVLVVVSGIGIWAAIKLMNATEVGRNPKDALKKARFWRNVNVTFMTLAFLGMFLTQSFVTSGINLIWHSVFLFIVSQYIRELSDAAAILAGNEMYLQQQRQPEQLEAVVFDYNDKV